ncbi:MAG: GxxExxY protein [Bacteroidetes bacterium]|nr:GxxExxY protein [Bacteroidota bacterium]
MIDDPLTYKIIGCAMKVHKILGPGFQEVIYQRCLAIEFHDAGLSIIREQEHTIFYRGAEVGTRRADFVVENKVVVEIKALVNLEAVHIAQAKNYTVAYDFPKGLLINFGAQSLQHKLLFNPKYNQGQNQDSQDYVTADFNRRANKKREVANATSLFQSINQFYITPLTSHPSLLLPLSLLTPQAPLSEGTNRFLGCW